MLATRLKAAVPEAGVDRADVTLYTGTGSGSQTITTDLDYTGSDLIIWVFQENSDGEWLSASTDPDQLDPASGDAEAPADISTLTSTGFDVDGGLNNAANYVAISLIGDAGFMLETTFTGTGSSQNVAHGLNATPELVIMKRLDLARNWLVWSDDMAFSEGLALNSDGAVQGYPDDITAVDGTNVTLDAANSADYVLYAFTSSGGNFDTGTYTGSLSDVSITTGFEPTTVWLKGDSISEWRIYFKDGSDSKYYDIDARSTTTDPDFDFDATGFTINGYENGNTVFYFAFA